MKKIVCLLFILISLIGFGVKAEENFDVSAKHAIAVEANTGKILYEKGEFFIGEAPEEIYAKANRRMEELKG